MPGAERKACLGMRQLEGAVFDVLFEVQRDGECPGVVDISRRAGMFGGKGDTSEGRARRHGALDTAKPGRGRDQQTGGDIRRERRCRQGRARRRGALEGRLVEGQIDRLVVTGGEVTVIDFKTGAPPSSWRDAPEGCRGQAADYAALVADVYPGRAIRGMLFYIDGPVLLAMERAI